MFLNEYEVPRPPKAIHGILVRFPKADEQKDLLDFRVVAQLAKDLGSDLGQVVAAFNGEALVSDEPLSFNARKVRVQIEGRILEVPVAPDRVFELVAGDLRYTEAWQAVINRKIDAAMRGMARDGRNYFEREGARRRGQFVFCQGAYIAAKARADGAVIVIDPRIQFSSSLNLWEMLRNELKKLEVSDWHSVEREQAATINRTFKSRAYNLRTDYAEITRWGDDETKSYRFLGFDFEHTIQQPMNGRSESPYDWHCKMGREDRVEPRDQPVVQVRAKGGFTVSQIPSLLRVSPDMMALRIFGLSNEAQNLSQKKSSDRVGAMVRYARILEEAQLIQDVEKPVEVEAETVAPVRWTVTGGYLDIRRAEDFQKYFSKGKLLRQPEIRHLTAFHEPAGRKETELLLTVLQKVARRFKVEWPSPLLVELPEVVDDRLRAVIEVAEKAGFGLADLSLLVVRGEESESDSSSFHDQVKRYSLTERLFPTQFVQLESIRGLLAPDSRDQAEAKLASDLGNMVFKQIVAKCGGIPHGLASGFASRGTLFVGVDRYRDSFGFDPSVSGAVSVFDEHGGHVVSTSSFFDRDPSDFIQNLEEMLSFAMRRAARDRQIWKVVLLRDGTSQREARREHEALRQIADQHQAEFVFVEAPKQTFTRIYAGQPDETGMFVEPAEPFTVAANLPGRRNEFIVLATDPWRGTPRPMVYRITDLSDGMDLNEEKHRLARGIAWLCAHSWVSPAATRLPVPLDYADKIARLSGRIRTSLRLDIDRPLYL